MEKQPLVSILIALYNQERYLDACMRSVCNQTYKNLEIVVVNDGSTDRSPQMIREWAARDNRIKIVDKQNEGLPFARRDGYLHATGEFVTFVDSDDLLPPRAIEILTGCIVKNDVDLVIGSSAYKLGFIRKNNLDGIFSFPRDQVVRQPELFDKYYVGFFRNSEFPISMWGRMFRKSCIDKAYKETELFSSVIRYMGEDHHFNLKIFPYLSSMYRTGENVYTYRYGGGTAKFNKHFTSLLWFADMRLKLLDQYDYEAGYEPLFKEYMACVYYHAAQLVHYKQADKAGVIDFFKQEVAERALIPRLKSFFKDKGTATPEMQLLINEDFEGMYQHACVLRKQQFCSLRYKMKHSLLWLLNQF